MPKIALTRRDLPVVLVTAAMLASGLWFFAGPALIAYSKPSRSEMQALQREGEQIVRGLDDFFGANSRYPDVLPGGAPNDLARRYGGWKYECTSICRDFILRVGAYNEHGFTMHWDSRRRAWHIDS